MNPTGPIYTLEPLEGRLLLSAMPRQMEYLNRGIVAVNKTSSTVYVSWRLLVTDPSNVAFNVYRSTNGAAAIKRNSNPITATTDFTDTSVTESQSNAYFVTPVINAVEQAASETWTIPANTPVRQYLNIPLTPPPTTTLPDGSTYTYNANDASVGDLDGDGQYEIILKWDPSDSHDSSQDGFTGDTYFDAYKLDGTAMWRIDLGRNIRAGAHYTQFMVYDLDGDGKAEVAMKTAPGTIDGQGNPVLLGSDKVTDDYRNATTGRINTGPEYLTIFNGQTGAAMASVPFKPDRINTSSWGDDYGNRQDRILMAVAYLDGQRPSLVVGRGLFPGQSSGHAVRNEITAWNWRNGQLSMLWWFRADKNASSFGLPDVNTAYVGQGNYEMQPADVDGDGKDEIVFGSMTVNDNGQPLYSTQLGHGDALYVSDMDPNHPGEEIYMPMESPGSNGHITVNVHDAATGQILFDTFTTPPGSTDPDVGRGNAMDIDPRYPGFETWDSYNPDIYNIATGTDIQPKASNMFINFGIWWDADPMRELLDGTTISDWRITNGVGGRSNYVFAPSGLTSNNGTKSTPCLVADLFGDWREEVIWRHVDASGNSDALQIWTTTIPAANRMDTLMEDTQYRESVAWQNVGYNQPTNTSFYLGSIESTGTQFPPIPTPNIYLIDHTPPHVVSASFQYQTSQSVQIGFDTPMDPNTIAATDLVLHPTAGGSDVIPSGVSYDVSTRIATFTFAAPIPDGDFTATLASASVSDAGSDALAGGFSFDLFILRGDANHDGTVNTADFNLVATNFNSTGTTWGQGDFNYDGKVNALDFNVLATKYGATLPAPPLSAAAQLSAPAKASAPLDLFGSASIQPVDRNLLDVLSPENSDSQASIPD